MVVSIALVLERLVENHALTLTTLVDSNAQTLKTLVSNIALVESKILMAIITQALKTLVTSSRDPC